jgi:hypothetical protein
MLSIRATARAGGVLYIVQMAAAVISYSVILEPLLYRDAFPGVLAEHASAVRLAMLLDLVCGASVFGIAIVLYPVLKRFSERVALWYVGQRLTELVSFMIGGFLLLVMLRIGQDITGGAVTAAADTEALATYLRSARGAIQNIALLIYCLGAWALYGLLFYSRLVPRFISVWGILAVALLCIEIMTNIYGTSAGGMMIMMPLGLNEVFLGIWLIVKGFNKTVISE